MKSVHFGVSLLVVVLLVAHVTAGDDDKKKDEAKNATTTVAPPKAEDKCICKFSRCETDKDCCSGKCLGGRDGGAKQCRPVFGNECDACKRRPTCVKKNRANKKTYTFTLG